MSNKATANKDHNRALKMNVNNQSKDKEKNYFLIPVIIVLCVIPLIVKFAIYDTHMTQFTWFAGTGGEKYSDLFLYYKSLIFTIISCVMALAAIVKSYYSRKTIRFIPVFIPLALYAFLALMSAVYSKYAYFSFHGSLEMFETVYNLLGYCVVVYYVYLFINTEKDFKLIHYSIIVLALILSLIGTFQFLGYDFFASKLSYNLIIPNQYRGIELTFNFEAKRVYLSLFNPNYVGVYVALVLPVILIMIFFYKSIVWRILSAFAVVGLVICVIGAQSLSGIIGLGAAIILIPILMRRYLIKMFYITVPVIIVLIIGGVIISSSTDHILLNKIKRAITITKSEPVLSDMQTTADGISITYNKNVMRVQNNINQNGISNLTAIDSDNNSIPTYIDPSTGTYQILDDRFSNIQMASIDNASGAFCILIDGKQWNFYKDNTDDDYYYINRYNKLDKMITAPSSIFTGYERFATGRGYIWSRTIPMLKKYIFLGSGPDTFTMAFPQQDYYNLYLNGYGTEILTKPHNMYLQMGVQTGVLSLIAFLIFYLMYFVSSIKLYIRGQFNSFYAKFGVAVFIGTVSYMVTGLANDSNICISPIFWTLMGVGIALNCKAKPLISEELAALKAEKEATKTEKEAAKA